MDSPPELALPQTANLAVSSPAPSDIERPEPARACLDRACAGLFARQEPDGSFHACDAGGPANTGMGLVALAYLGSLHLLPAQGAVDFLFSQQLPTGSFPAFDGDTKGSLAAAACCYAGLVVSGVPVTDERMQRSWQYILDTGGFEAADPITQTFLAAAGLYDPTWLPDVPLAWELLPGARLLLGDLLIAPLHLIACALPGLIRGLRRRRSVPTPRESLLGWMETQDLIDYLKKIQDPTGTWMGTLLHTAICAMTLHALGLPVVDPAIARAIARFPSWRYGSSRGWQLAPYNSETWNTALAVGSLRSAGVPSSDPRIALSTAFLLSTQGKLDQPREWQKPARGAPRSGGWSFEMDNSLCLDSDSTGQTLRALAMVRELSSVPAAIQDGLPWLLGMQNDDGGWPAFTHGLPSKPAGPYPLGLFASGAQIIDMPKSLKSLRLFIGDPSTEDLTGRVLTGLGALGLRVGTPAVDKAVSFLKSQIFDNGAWWGRWECNYLPGTAYVLTGLAAVGADLTAPWVRRAVTWLEDHQNPDGGFGETIDSYVNLTLAGTGQSNSYTTGLVLSALAVTSGRREVMARAAEYLIRTQGDDGLWTGGDYQIVLNNPLPFYKVPADAWTAPLQGLADYLALGGGVSGV